MQVHAEGLHVGDALLGRPEGAGVIAMLIVESGRADAEPVVPALYRPQRAARGDMSMNVQDSYCHNCAVS